MGLLKEFREFAVKGNVIDLAVGVVIGAAFGKIVTSLVGDVVMPVVGVLTSGVDFSQYVYELRPASTVDGKVTEAVVLKVGAFAKNIVDFIIVAFVIFLVVKLINTAKKRFEREQEVAVAAAPPEDVLLLREIRDSLKTK